ncbi:hypothetical protein [Streptomyces inusitatus]|nr:hypothetical protein [Streptomyces inusitatus]
MSPPSVRLPGIHRSTPARHRPSRSAAEPAGPNIPRPDEIETPTRATGR